MFLLRVMLGRRSTPFLNAVSKANSVFSTINERKERAATRRSCPFAHRARAVAQGEPSPIGCLGEADIKDVAVLLGLLLLTAMEHLARVRQRVLREVNASKHACQLLNAAAFVEASHVRTRCVAVAVLLNM